MDKQYKSEKRLKLQLQHVYGSSCNRNYHESVGLGQDGGTFNVIYPVGKHIAIKATDRSDLSFIRLNENMEKIDCMAFSPDKKQIAIAEKQYEVPKQIRRPTFSIYSVKYVAGMKFINAERKTQVYAESEGDKFIHMKYSNNGQNLILLTSDFKLVFWDAIRFKEKASVYHLKHDISRISFHPTDQNIIYISGPQMFISFVIKESTFCQNDQNITGRDFNLTQNFICHTWIDQSRIALANDNQDVYIIYQGAAKLYSDIFQNNRDPSYQITGIIGINNGFIVSSNYGTFSVWMKNSDPLMSSDEDYQYLRTFSSERKHAVASMDIILIENLLAASFTNNDIGTFDLNKILPKIQEPIESYKRNKALMKRQEQFQFLYRGFHFGNITSLDVCLQRPLVVTVSKEDQTIRLWNYINFKCELARQFDVKNQVGQPIQSLLCAAIHPTGYILAAGFVDKVRIFHILNSNLRDYKQLNQKGAIMIKYSHGGQYMAVTSPKPKTTQHVTIIYNAYTFEQVTVLKAHSQLVTDLVWYPDDETVATCGQDGVVQENRQFMTKQDKNDYPQNIKQINTMLFNENTRSYMIAGYNDTVQMGQVTKLATEDNPQDKEVNFSLKIQDQSPYQINSMCYVVGQHKYTGIIAGLSDGHMCTFGHIFQAQYNDKLASHDEPITRVAASPDGQYCFSVGQDGCLYIYNIQELNEEGQVLKFDRSDKNTEDLNPKALVVDPLLADVVLVNKEEIDRYLNDQKKLQTDYEDLGSKMEQNAEEEKKRMEQQIREKEEKCQIEIRQWTNRYNELKEQKTQIEKEASQLLKGMENNHTKAVEELENLYEKKLNFEADKYMAQESDLMNERTDFEGKLKEIEMKHEAHINELKGTFNNQFQNAQYIYKETQSTANQLNKEYEEKLDQQEEEHEMEIREINDKHANKLAEQNDKITDLSSKNDMLKREEKIIQDNMEKMTKQMKDNYDKTKRLEERLSDANNQIEILKSDKKNLEEQLTKKEKKIHEYKYKINDLQKSKHVLSFRATEMRKSLEPKEAQIDKLKDELFKLEGEFEAMLKTSQVQNDKMKKQESQIDSLSRSLKSQIGQTNQKESMLNKIIMKIHDCVKETDTKYWNQEMQNLYDTYVINTTIKSSQHDAKGVEEMTRHIQHLEKSIKQMNNSSEKMIQRRDQEVHKKLKENAELINDLNEMRKLNKDYFTELSNKKMECDKLKKDIEDLHNQLEQSKFKSRPQSHLQQLPQQQQQMARTQNKFIDHKQQAPRPQSMRIPNRPQGKQRVGANFNSKGLANFEKAKFMDLIAQQEISSSKILQQNQLIKDIRKKIKIHLGEHRCIDLTMAQEAELLNQEEELFSGQRMSYY